MRSNDILASRLYNQHLLEPLAKPQDVVGSLTAIQSQDFPGALWAIGQRSQHATSADITKLYNDGKILRLHMLRPTWHFVAPEDIGWIQELTAPRVQAFCKYYYKKLELTDDIFVKATKTLESALKGNVALSRKEIREVYSTANIDASGLRFSFLVMHAELEGKICSGPMKGKQHTYALVSDRAPQAKTLSREKALKELTQRFFTSHGPATIKDFSWWSSLTAAEVKAGIQLAKVPSHIVDGKEFFYATAIKTVLPSPSVYLLPNYDEYLIAYKERSPYTSNDLDKTPNYGELSHHFVIADGKLVGGWLYNRTSKEISLDMFKNLGQAHQTSLQKSIRQLEKFEA